MKRRPFPLAAFFALVAFAGQPSPARAANSAAIRFLIPNAPFSLDSEKELADVVTDYNRDHPGSMVQLIRRGDNFSSLRELMAMHLAGDTPDIAAIETSEFPSIQEIALARTLPPELVARLVSPERPKSSARSGARKRAARTKLHKIFTLPFMRIVPVLVADQEMLFRVHADPDHLPTDWKGLVALAKSLTSVPGSVSGSSSSSADRYSLALPLEGTRGLWLFESLAGRPLWTRRAGGLQSNRELAPAVTELRSVIDEPRMSRPEETWDRAVQDFLDRKSPLLATSTDMLPYIAKQASFRWAMTRLPDLQGDSSPLEGGSDLIVTRNTPEVLAFVEYLYSAPAAARWARAGAYYPLRKDWEKSPLWKLPPLDPRHRTTDTDVVRAHTEWVSALHFLFGEKNKRLTPETVFTQLDTELISK